MTGWDEVEPRGLWDLGQVGRGRHISLMLTALLFQGKEPQLGFKGSGNVSQISGNRQSFCFTYFSFLCFKDK